MKRIHVVSGKKFNVLGNVSLQVTLDTCVKCPSDWSGQAPQFLAISAIASGVDNITSKSDVTNAVDEYAHHARSEDP
jgi:hypothetical protein